MALFTVPLPLGSGPRVHFNTHSRTHALTQTADNISARTRTCTSARSPLQPICLPCLSHLQIVILRWGGSPLADAVREGHLTVATELHAAGALLKFDEAQASSALCEYARKGDTNSIDVLLSAGADANAADYDGR
eukprot:5037208-Pleurochrysis_carterae.AAC.4